ncbi:MAG: TolC family protein [Thermoanaerobaculia bacterium]
MCETTAGLRSGLLRSLLVVAVLSVAPAATAAEPPAQEPAGQPEEAPAEEPEEPPDGEPPTTAPLADLVRRVPGLREVPTRVAPPEEAEAEALPGEPGGPPGPLALDLERAVELALERNPGLRAVEERIDEVTAGVEEARADAFPQLALTSGWSRSRNPAFLNNPDFEEIVEQFPGGDFEPSEQELYSVAAEVTQPLYTFGKIEAAVELARLAGGVAEAQIEAARLETALAAAEAYYELVAAERAVEAVEAQQRARREALEVVEARYEIGEATRLELLRARSSLAELGPELAGRRGDAEVAESRLRVTLGLAPGTELDPREASGPELAAPPGLSALVARARSQRPELVDLALQRDTLEKRQEIVQAEGKPQIELTGSYGREVRLPENVTDPLFADWLVAVGMRWELFDGGRRRGEVARLESERQQLGWELRDLESRIALDIETALARYRAARARLESARLSAETAREASRVAAETYREGVTLQADLLDAQQREVEAEIQRIDAAARARIEAFRLARAVGEYPTGTGWAATPPDEPESP